MPTPAALSPDTDDQALIAHLVAARLAGHVATTISSCLGNVAHLVDGHPAYTFGLSDWKDATHDEVVAAVEAAGGEPRGRPGADEKASDDAGGDHAEGAWIDPLAAAAGIAVHRDTLAPFLAEGGACALVATGHPFALLAHYGAIARALAAAGCTVLRPLEGRRGRRGHNGRTYAIRYLDGVACFNQDAALQHTHRPDYMEAMLDDLGGPEGVDLVVADHGFAGAAVEAGIRTLSIADVNDPALPLAQARGRTDGVLVIDDGLDASLFEPVTRAVLGR